MPIAVTVMLDGKEINETAKRFLLNWKASRDARRRQRRQFHFLEGGTSSNLVSESSKAFSSIPSLPLIQGLVNPSSDSNVTGIPQSDALPRGTRPLAAIMQARVPNSTLVNMKPVQDISQSRYCSLIMMFQLYLLCQRIQFLFDFSPAVLFYLQKSCFRDIALGNPNLHTQWMLRDKCYITKIENSEIGSLIIAYSTKRKINKINYLYAPSWNNLA